MDSNDITRRRTLGTLGAAGIVALAGCGGSDSDDGDGGGADGDDGTGGDTSGDGSSDGSDDGSTDDAGDGSTDDGGETDEELLEGSLTIGLLQDFSGPLPQYGHQGTSGFYAGLAYLAGVDPLPESAIDEGTYSIEHGDGEIEILARDTQFNPGTAQELATELVQDEGADMLYGTASSGSAIRVINTVVDRSEVPFIAGPAANAGITANDETCRELVFRANENTAMDARSGGAYIGRSTDIEQMALFGADYSFGRAVVNNYKEVLQNEGVEIVYERFVPQGYSEWAGLFDEAEQAGAQGMVGGFTAQTLPFFNTTYLNGDWEMRAFGGLASRVTLAGVGSTLQDTLSADQFTEDGINAAGFGPYTSRYHWNQYDNQINDDFVEMHQNTYNVVPDLFTSGAFSAASAVMQSFDQAGEISGDVIPEEMSGMTVEVTPKGENGYEFQEWNNQARSGMTIANVIPTRSEWADTWPAAIQPSEPIETIPKEVVTIPESEGSCDLS